MLTELQPVTIEKLVEGGWGLVRQGSVVIFVRGVIPGERVTTTTKIQHKGYQKAAVCEVLEPSPDRVPAPCSVYGVCGGCHFQHIRYAAQLCHKQAVLTETLARVGKIQTDRVLPPIPSPELFGYRSTVRFVVFRHGQTFRLGFNQEGTNQPIEAERCLLVPDGARDVISSLAKALGAQARLPLRLISIEIRRSVATGSTVLVHRTGTTQRDRAAGLFRLFQNVPGVVGQVVTAEDGRVQHRWVEGQDWIEDRLGELTFRISDRSFMQVNWPMNAIISRMVCEWVQAGEGRRVLELYAGIGTMGLPLARSGALVTEVEANRHAIADARHAAKVNHVGRCRFRHVRAEAMLEQVQPGEYDVILVDPPRAGLSSACLEGLVRTQVPRLLYLSCDAATLGRDLGRLCSGGYRVRRLQPFDMFPQTAHLETLVELAR